MHQAAGQTATALPAVPRRQARESAQGVTAEQRQSYWDALMARDERSAWTVVRQALEDGADPEYLLLDLIAAAQRRIGADWAAARLTVGQEHAATAIGDRVIAALAAHPGFRDAQAPAAGRLAVACADGEWHAMPARLLAEVFALRGWRVDFLGAHVPGPHLVAHLHQSGPDAVALSASLATRLPSAHAVITACQAVGVPVLAGGAAFGPGGRYARQFNADGWAGDARAAAESLEPTLARPHPPHQLVDDLPHLSDQEYTLLSRGRQGFVAAVLADLPARFPAMRDYGESQMRHTEEDIVSIVEYLACAAYVDDVDLFVGFTQWTRDILEARGVPARALVAGLEVTRDRLREFPRACGFLTAALERVKEERVNPPDGMPPVARVRSDLTGVQGLDLCGDLDHDSVGDFHAALDEVFARMRPGQSMVLDCSRLEFCDSTGLAALLMAQRKAAGCNIGILLRGRNAYLRNLLEVAGISTLFQDDVGPGAAAVGGAELEWRSGKPVVRLYGELDDDCADAVRHALDKAVAASPDGISVDLAEVCFADSTMLHLLLSARDSVPVRLIGPLRPEIRLLLEVAGLTGVFGLSDGDGAVAQEVRA